MHSLFRNPTIFPNIWGRSCLLALTPLRSEATRTAASVFNSVGVSDLAQGPFWYIPTCTWQEGSSRCPGKGSPWGTQDVSRDLRGSLLLSCPLSYGGEILRVSNSNYVCVSCQFCCFKNLFPPFGGAGCGTQGLVRARRDGHPSHTPARNTPCSAIPHRFGAARASGRSQPD